MLYEEEQIEGIPTPTKQTEIRSVLEEIRNSNEALHKIIEQLVIRLNSVLKEEIEEGKEAKRQPPFITKLAQQFNEEDWKIKIATRKIRKLMDRLEV